MILYNTGGLSESRLTAAALAVLLQQLSLRTDTVVRSRSAHTLVLTAVLHCVTQVHVCKNTVNKHIYTCTDTHEYKLGESNIVWHCIHSEMVLDRYFCLLSLYFQHQMPAVG